MSDTARRRYVLEEVDDNTWRMTEVSTGDIREASTPQVLAACIFGDFSPRPDVVAVADWVTGELAALHAQAVARDEADEAWVPS